MYDTSAELLQAVAAGGDSVLELKQLVFEGSKIVAADEGKAAPWLARQLSAFTNANGGVLVLGVADDGMVVGIPQDRMDDVQAFVINVARSSLEPLGDHLLLLDAMSVPTADGDRLVLKIDIRADMEAVHAPSGKRPYVRVGNTTREVSMEQLPRLLARRSAMVPADERVVVGTTEDDLDWPRLERYHQRRFDRPAGDLRRFARNLKLVVDDELGAAHLTIAGVLVFGVHPQDDLPHARIDLASYDALEPDTDRRLDSRTFAGTIVDQVEAATAYLAQSPFVRVRSTKTAEGREDRPTYSGRALQEAVVNAVAHRDYAIAGAQARIQLFGDRIEITSPGRLPNSLTPDDLFAGARPVRRNQLLVGFFSGSAVTSSGRALMEGMGEGFLTIVRESERLSGKRPELRQHTEAITVRIFAGQPVP